MFPHALMDPVVFQMALGDFSADIVNASVYALVNLRNEEMEPVLKWMSDNKLKLKPDKKELLLPEGSLTWEMPYTLVWMELHSP